MTSPDGLTSSGTLTCFTFTRLSKIGMCFAAPEPRWPTADVWSFRMRSSMIAKAYFRKRPASLRSPCCCSQKQAIPIPLQTRQGGWRTPDFRLSEPSRWRRGRRIGRAGFWRPGSLQDRPKCAASDHDQREIRAPADHAEREREIRPLASSENTRDCGEVDR